MLKLKDLATRPDFKVGELRISPSRRLFEGPAGKANVEPLIMQVLLILLEARGHVVTRQELFDQCWGGVVVGDDSLNRAIAKVRKIAGDVAPGLFEIETIPRTGYRLVGDMPGFSEGVGSTIERRRFPRRAVVGGALAAGAAAAGLLWTNGRQGREYDELMAQGEEVLDYGDTSGDAAGLFRRAVALRPRDAKAQGLLAFSRALYAEYGGNRGSRVSAAQAARTASAPGYGAESAASAAVVDAERAARAALAIDPKEPDARLALTLLQRSTLDLAANEDRIRSILADDPRNIRAMSELWSLLQCAGRSHDALAMIDRAIALKPLAASNNYPRAQLLWILGRNAEADRVIDRALQYWPAHRFVRFARFIILAFTDRPRAALAMLDGRNTAPQTFGPQAVALWRISLTALDQRTPASIAAARTANLSAAQANLALASQAILVLSALGEIDAAFKIANDLFAIPGNAPVTTPAGSAATHGTSMAWRFAPWLFIPPTAPMRTDARFTALCDGAGLTDYWRKRSIGPDRFLFTT